MVSSKNRNVDTEGSVSIKVELFFMLIKDILSV
jgi:hypothetical protein